MEYKQTTFFTGGLYGIRFYQQTKLLRHRYACARHVCLHYEQIRESACAITHNIALN